VAKVAALYLNMEGTGVSYGKKHMEFPSGLTAAFRAHGLQGEAADFALFWDFPSLFQPPRTDGESDLFKQGLGLSNVWYGHAASTCWMQSELPAGFAGNSYEMSGWCFVEAAICAAIKPAAKRLDLALRTEDAMGCAYGPDEPPNPDYRLTHACMRRRLPPPSPEKVARLLETEKQFTNSSDTAKVAQLYATFFGKVVEVESLVFQAVGWGDAEAVELCEVLPRFGRLRSLDVSKNKVGEEGARSLAAYVAVSASLTKLDVRYNGIKGEGAERLAAAVLESKLMEEFSLIPMKGLRADEVTELDLSAKGLGPAEARVIGSLLTVNASLTSLSLGGNELGDEGATALARALKESKVSKLASLDLTGKGYGASIGPVGAKELAEYISVSSSLTKLDVIYNAIGAEGEKALRYAVKGREGFDLQA
jgi:hypothetical protein